MASTCHNTCSTQTNPPRLLSVAEAAARLNIGQTSLREHIRERRISTIKLGRRVLLDPADLDAWIAASTRTAKAPQ